MRRIGPTPLKRPHVLSFISDMTAILKLYYIIVLRYHKYTSFIAIILTEPCADLVNKMVDARQAQLRSSSFTQRYGG